MSTRNAELASLASLLADRTRAGFCLALLDGRAWTASELARHAGVAASTTSEHLDRLIGGGLLVERRQGRHRYVQLAGPQVADLIEALAAHAEPVAKPAGTLKAATVASALARGRTCYDHLAGRLGVAITDAMTRRGLLDQDGGFALTGAGLDWLTGTLGADARRLRSGRRPLARACLDWTERRSHLAGVAGAYICEHFRANEWIRRIGSDRAVRLTPAGESALHDLLGLDAAAL
ncbi:ArsR/SmtB family transcription factor [Fodinicola acaciae]|uniref:ArsR/SmtB family transcription factor n=1 Tax=Fodinicola acaciae TaxID=2681555 RepID=UPI0013D690EB|nr:winged helix-turn-helix domain-containing protein [Fodinicola acaciae]